MFREAFTWKCLAMLVRGGLEAWSRAGLLLLLTMWAPFVQ